MSLTIDRPPVDEPVHDDGLEQRLAEIRLAAQGQRRLVTTCIAAATGLLLAGVLVAVDYCWELSHAWRLAGAALTVVATVAAALAVRRRWRRYDLKRAAADVESGHPEYGQRIRTSLDYNHPETSPAPASPNLVAALRQDAGRHVEGIRVADVLPRRPARLAMAVLATLILLAAVVLLCSHEMRIAAARLFLLPLDYREITVEDVDRPLRLGEDLVVKARIDGRPANAARVRYRPAGEAVPWQEVPLQPADGPSGSPPEALAGDLQATIPDRQEDFEFQVVTDRRRLPIQRVQVLQPLELESFAVHVESPAYTRRPPQTFEQADVKVVEGGQVTVEITLNRDAAQVALQPLGQTKPELLPPPELDATAIRVRLPELRTSLQLAVTARAADGMEFESERIRIQVEPDKKPRVRFVSPPEDLEVTPTTEVPLAVDAADDFGLRKIGVAYKVGDGPLNTLWEQQLTEAPDARQARPVLFLERHRLSFQDAVTYFAYAEDNRSGEAGRTVTELRFIDIRPYKREYQMLEGGGT